MMMMAAMPMTKSKRFTGSTMRIYTIVKIWEACFSYYMYFLYEVNLLFFTALLLVPPGLPAEDGGALRGVSSCAGLPHYVRSLFSLSVWYLIPPLRWALLFAIFFYWCLPVYQRRMGGPTGCHFLLSGQKVTKNPSSIALFLLGSVI